MEQAMGHCRRDNLWRRLFHGEHQHLAMDKLKLSKLYFSELEERLNAVQSQSVGEIDPQLDCFLTMSPSWYQSLIKVPLTRFPQSCRHFDQSGIQYLAVLNQKFTDCFVLVFLENQAGKTSLKVVFREPLPSQPQPRNSPSPQLVSMHHHLESDQHSLLQLVDRAALGLEGQSGPGGPQRNRLLGGIVPDRRLNL
ncbi:KICSTOR complex protein SZT2 [Oncorhynchus tshawytscha]|uniref:KICSTOR complex protein SZT2 n=1 Tax=Oncorhynchus tshawytscha TaxID=74940 RepID=UPI000D099A19|nr:KICSTOR complex protein SZT2 [Oncorhynchus tshawytscha]